MVYQTGKKIVKALLPRPLLLQWEGVLRRLLRWHYRGTAAGCNICGARLARFETLPSGDLLCPACGSLPRNRRLWALLQRDFHPAGRLIDFSPSRCLYRQMQTFPGIEYVATDYTGEFPVPNRYDIQNLPVPNESFDAFLCYHVLEHVPDDRAAIRELFRILRPGGWGLIQTPFQDGYIYENPAIVSPADRKKHFGQEDHVRIYSLKGLASRLQEAGFEVKIRSFEQQSDPFLGLNELEKIICVRKPG